MINHAGFKRQKIGYDGRCVGGEINRPSGTPLGAWMLIGDPPLKRVGYCHSVPPGRQYGFPKTLSHPHAPGRKGVLLGISCILE